MPSDNFSTSGYSSASEAMSENRRLLKSAVLGNLSGGGSGSNGDGKDLFWDFAEINESHWNKSFPYQLVVLKKEENGYTMKDKFTLPINPTELSITSPFAITTSVTLGGIVEEHNGSPIKMISLSGSTGFLPLKGSPEVGQSLAGAIFAGTLSGVSKIGTGIKAVVSGGNTSASPNLIDDKVFEESGELKAGTGYYQFMLLRNFLEAYVALKKTTAGAPYRLAFVIWKDTEAWLVSPVSFDLKRSAGSAMEYMYSIQLKAWKRYSPTKDPSPKAFQNAPLVRSPNALAAALNSFRAARAVLLGAKAVLTGFRADVDAALFLPLRETGMFIKDAIGVGLTAQDLPIEIMKDCKNSILEFLAGPSSAALFKSSDQQYAKIRALLQDLGMITGLADTKANPIGSRRDEARSDQTKLGINEAHPGNKIFDNPDKYAALFDAIPVGRLSLKPATLKKIVQERERVRKLTRLDFEKIRDGVVALASDYADFVGAGGDTYSRVYNRPIATANRTPTDDDWDVMFQLNQTAIEFNRLAASTATDTKNNPTAMEYLAGQAARSGIPFRVPASAYAIPFPYGSTLEMVANRYLGTPDRWHELAILNNLRPPYVDEEGFDLAFLTNGSGNYVQVSDGTQLYLGQPVWLSSTTVSREKRRVSSIQKLSPTVWVIGLDGEGDLAKFTTAGNASVFAFIPGTVNSLQLLYIPSDSPPVQPDYEPKGNEAIDEFNAFLRVGGMDLLLTERGDLAIMKDGDCRLSIGLGNIVQHVKLIMSIEPGTLMRHPSVGFAVKPGTSTADVTAKDILNAAKQSFANDKTFTGIGAASIVKNGPALSISLSLGVTGISHFIPITFAIKTT